MAIAKPAPLENGLDSPLSPTTEAVARLPRALAFRYDALPLFVEDGTLVIGLADPSDVKVLDPLRSATRMRLRPVRLARDVIRERLIAAYGADTSAAAFDRRGSEAPAVRAVDDIFRRAIEAHASDIHVEPAGNGGRVRLRIDGILREIAHFDAEVFTPFTSRLKLLAG